MLFEDILPVVFVILGVCALCIVSFWPRFVPFLLAATLPCNNFLIDWYVQWTPGKIVLLAVALVLPFHFLNQPKVRPSLKLPRALSGFLAVELLLTVIAYLLFQNSLSDPGLDAMRSVAYRPFVQLISQWMRVGALLAIIRWVNDRETVLRVYKVCLGVTSCAALYGLYQFIGFYAEWPITGISRAQTDLDGGYALIQVAGIQLFRIGSFVGEPKYLAQWLVPSIIFIACTKIFPKMQTQSWLTSYPVLFLHIVAFTLTFATSAYLGVCLGLLPIAWLSRGGKANPLRVATVVGIIAVTVCGFILVAGDALANDALLQRTVGRVRADEPSLVVDMAAVQFLQEHPRYLVSGVGLGNGTFHLADYVPDWVENYYPNPVPLSVSSMYLLLLLEGGIPVLALFVFFLIKSLFKAREIALSAEATADVSLLLTSVVICCMVAMLGGFYSTEEDGMLWLYWGILFAVCGIVQRAKRKDEPREGFSTNEPRNSKREVLARLRCVGDPIT
jgi:hypothetical protein